MAGTIAAPQPGFQRVAGVSMESGLDGRNNLFRKVSSVTGLNKSQWSPA